MIVITIVWISFLCLKPIDATGEELIEQNVCLNNTNHPFLLKVELKDEKYSIIGHVCLDHTISDSNTTMISKMHAFNLLTNCKLASHIVCKIKVILNKYDSFYHHTGKIEEPERFWVENELKDDIQKFLSFINTLVCDFSVLISDIVTKNLEDFSINSNTFILKQLFTLLIKTNYIKYNEEKKCNISSLKILRLFHMEMLELQRYMLINCDESIETIENSLFTNNIGDLVKINVNDCVANDNIQRLFDTMKKTMRYGELLNDRCKVENLLNFINIYNDVVIYKHIIKNMEISITNGHSVSMEDIVDPKIVYYYDLNSLLLCHQYILTTIIKQFTKNFSFIIKRKIKSKTQNKFDETYKIIKENPDKQFLLDIFQKFKNQTSISLLKNYVPTQTDSLNISQYFDAFKPTRQYGVDISNEMVQQILDFFQKDTIQISSAEYYFKPLLIQYNNGFNPMINNSKCFIKKSDDYSYCACNFVISIISLCYQASSSLNKSVGDISVEVKDTNHTELQSIIGNLKNIFISIVKKPTDKIDIDILTMAYEVSILLVNFKLDFQNESFHIKLQRVLNVIVNEMYKYEIHHCTLQNPYVFRSFQIDTIRKHNHYHRISVYMERNLNNFKPDDLNYATSIVNGDWEFLSIDYMNETFVKKSRIFNEYRNKIKIIWNGSKKNITEIFNESVTNFNPLVVLSLYEVFFKASLTVVVLRIYEISSNTSLAWSDFINNMNSLNKTLYKDNNWINYFPSAMTNAIQNLYTQYLEKNPTPKLKQKFENDVIDLKEDLETKYNIVFENQDSNFLPQIEFETHLLELLLNLKTAYNCYSNITKIRDTL